MQRTVVMNGLRSDNFRSNHGGFILHRGRSGVAAAAAHHPNHPYATVTRNRPHFMGVANGASIWQETERRFEHLLRPGAEALLIDHLQKRFVGHNPL